MLLFSTLSSALNGLAAVTGEDVVKKFISPAIEEKKYTMVLKGLGNSACLVPGKKWTYLFVCFSLTKGPTAILLK